MRVISNGQMGLAKEIHELYMVLYDNASFLITISPILTRKKGGVGWL